MKQTFCYRIEFTFDEGKLIYFKYCFHAMRRIISRFCDKFDIEWKVIGIDT